MEIAERKLHINRAGPSTTLLRSDGSLASVNKVVLDVLDAGIGLGLCTCPTAPKRTRHLAKLHGSRAHVFTAVGKAAVGR